MNTYIYMKLVFIIILYCYAQYYVNFKPSNQVRGRFHVFVINTSIEGRDVYVEPPQQIAVWRMLIYRSNSGDVSYAQRFLVQLVFA